MKNKIKTRAEIKRLVKQLKKNGKKIVTTNGSFDLLHVGHVRFLQQAKKQGDILILGLNSDSSVRMWKKGMGYKDWASRPLIPQQHRAEMLAALECVDYVTIFNEPDCLKFVESVKPDVHVNGSEYGEECIEAGIIKKYGGSVYVVKLYKGFSTTDLIRKLRELYA